MTTTPTTTVENTPNTPATRATRRRRRRGAALAVGGLVAMSGPGTAFAADPAPAAGPAESPACGESPECQVRAVVDVDGDGRPDEIALHDQGDPTTIELRVATATGLRTLTVPRDDYAAVDPWFGTTELDANPGAEIVLRSSTGAHTSWHTVVTAAGGGLAVVPVPGAGPDDPTADSWVVDSSYSSNIGVTVERPGVVTLRSAFADEDFTAYDTTEQTWSQQPDGAWLSDGPLQEVRVGTAAFDAPLPPGFQGWYAAGLPNY